MTKINFKTMMNNKDHSQDLIRKLVQKSDLESPADGFTDNIMNKIQIENQIESVNADTTFTTLQWMLVFVPCLVLVVGSLYYFRKDFAGIFNMDFITQTFLPYIKGLFAKGSDVISKQEFSPIFITMLISVGFLMIIDRFVHIVKRMKSYLFTF